MSDSNLAIAIRQCFLDHAYEVAEERLTALLLPQAFSSLQVLAELEAMRQAGVVELCRERRALWSIGTHSSYDDAFEFWRADPEKLDDWGQAPEPGSTGGGRLPEGEKSFRRLFLDQREHQRTYWREIGGVNSHAWEGFREYLLTDAGREAFKGVSTEHRIMLINASAEGLKGMAETYRDTKRKGQRD